MDFMRGLTLGQGMDAAREDERHDCIRRLFAVLTARLEDAATLATKGQARMAADDKATDLAAQVQDIATQTTTSAEAIELLCQQA